MLFTALDFTFITRHIQKWVLFSLWLILFILSGSISLLFPSSILDTYYPGEFIFKCHIFLPFHSVHGILQPGILKWFAIPFSSGPCFIRTQLSSTKTFIVRTVVEKLDNLINNSNISTYTLYVNLCHQCDVLHYQVILPFQLIETHLLLEIWILSMMTDLSFQPII